MQYSPYGSIITSTAMLATDRLYTGQRREESIDLYDYRARFYDPLAGSFISPDSIVPEVGHSRGWNRYGYVFGNPVRYSDPSGHCPPGARNQNGELICLDSYGVPIDSYYHPSFTQQTVFPDLSHLSLQEKREGAVLFSTGALFMDTMALLSNGVGAITTDGFWIIGGPKGYALGAVIHNAVPGNLAILFDSVGVVLTAGSGIYSEENYILIEDRPYGGTLEISISQDTTVASNLFSFGFFNPEPNADALLSALGVAYSLGRFDEEGLHSIYSDEEFGGSVLLKIPTFVDPGIFLRYEHNNPNIPDSIRTYEGHNRRKRLK